MVEMDEEIAAVWASIVNGDAAWLAHRILSFELSKETVLAELAKKPPTLSAKKHFRQFSRIEHFTAEFLLRALVY